VAANRLSGAVYGAAPLVCTTNDATMASYGQLANHRHRYQPPPRQKFTEIPFLHIAFLLTSFLPTSFLHTSFLHNITRSYITRSYMSRKHSGSHARIEPIPDRTDPEQS
jgi:hypothetical protein